MQMYVLLVEEVVERDLRSEDILEIVVLSLLVIRSPVFAPGAMLIICFEVLVVVWLIIVAVASSV